MGDSSKKRATDWSGIQVASIAAKGLTSNRWLVLAITLLEALVAWKDRIGAGNMLDNPWPWYIAGP